MVGRFAALLKPDHIKVTENLTRMNELIKAEIVRINKLSPTVKGLTLKLDRKPQHLFKSGQWVDFHIPDLETIGGFSVCSTPKQLETRNTIDLAVKYSAHPPAEWVHNSANEGDEVRIRFGGEFYYPNKVTIDGNNQRRILLIAGGVGINPIYSIAKFIHETENGDSAAVRILYSAKTEEELIFRDELNSMSGFKVMTAVTSEEERIGVNSLRRSLELENAVVQDKDATFCYICGPNQMIKDIEKALLELGLKKSNIFYELWW